MPSLSVFMLRTALIHLGIGFTFGALMLSNKGIPYAPIFWRLLPSHIELVLMGWTMQLVMGVAFWILPRHSGVHKYGSEILVWQAYACLNGGVTVSALGLAVSADVLVFAGRLLELIAVILFAIAIFPRIKAIAT